MASRKFTDRRQCDETEVDRIEIRPRFVVFKHCRTASDHADSEDSANDNKFGLSGFVVT